ncbi:hypothetical protein ACFLTK_02030 [Chloroflexota bacterium]
MVRQSKLFTMVITIALITAMAVGCAGPSLTPQSDEEEIGTVNVLGVWDGDELESFQAMVSLWADHIGGAMAFSGTI